MNTHDFNNAGTAMLKAATLAASLAGTTAVADTLSAPRAAVFFEDPSNSTLVSVITLPEDSSTMVNILATPAGVVISNKGVAKPAAVATTALITPVDDNTCATNGTDVNVYARSTFDTGRSSDVMAELFGGVHTTALMWHPVKPAGALGVTGETMRTGVVLETPKLTADNGGFLGPDCVRTFVHYVLSTKAGKATSTQITNDLEVRVKAKGIADWAACSNIVTVGETWLNPQSNPNVIAAGLTALTTPKLPIDSTRATIPTHQPCP